MRVFLDTETYNGTTDIKVGTYRYASTCELLVVGYMPEDDHLAGAAPRVWDATAHPMPSDLAEILQRPDTIFIAHNALFDRLVLHYTLNLPLDPTRWRCAMARALAHSLPGALGKLGPIMGLPEDQLKAHDGRALVLRFCKPWKGRKVERYTRENSPEQWGRFVEYCRQDVVALAELWRRLPSWNYADGSAELDIWHLDQTINDRGAAVDTGFAAAAVRAASRVKEALAARTAEITHGAIDRTTQRDKLLGFILDAYGVDLPDSKATTVERRLTDPNLPEDVRELLAIRLQASVTSASKYAALLKGVNDDGRLRGTLQYCGAMRTGRWAGRTFQPQNLKRVPKYLKKQYDFAVDCILSDCEDIIFDDPMDVIASTVRGAIIAPRGCKLNVSDLSNIEGRVLAWLAGERWKVKAFADGVDLYVVGYAKSFGVSEADVIADHQAGGTMRLIGKVQELALGYQGAEGAFVSMAAVYGVDMDSAYPAVWGAASAEAREGAVAFYEWAQEKNLTRGLNREQFLASCIVKAAWRKANANIVSFWADLETAVRSAIEQPDVSFECRKLVVRRSGNWLRIRLPSGRFLCYPGPRVDEHGKMSYMGVDQYTRKWQRTNTYGGKLVENVTQATSRDVLAYNMPYVEAAGYPIVLTVHDEIITETPDRPQFSAARLSELLATAPPWASGLPLAAGGYETRRYRKD